MVKTLLLGVLALLVVAQIIKAEIGNNRTSSNIKNVTERKIEATTHNNNQIKNSIEEKLKHVETRRRSVKIKKHRSTSSSSSGEKVAESQKEDDKESLEDSISDYNWQSSKERKRDEEDHDRYEPKSTVERHGWRKYHRKCHQCLDDMKKKWRDPSINWICGGYQRARRSFKSLCMMHYRNCQDGTMFLKIHDHRCENSSSKESIRHGKHFFYDYKVKLPDDSTDSSDDDDTSTSKDSSSESFDVIN